MGVIGAAVRYVFAHSRPQFHPAAWALLYGATFVAAVSVLTFVVSLVFRFFGSTGVDLDHEGNAALGGPVLLGELVRGHVKTWLGYRPEEWCLPAIGVAGLAAGGAFGVFMALKWHERVALLPLEVAAGGAALYLLLGWLMRFAERSRPTE